MGRMEQILQSLRRQVEQLEDRAGPGPDALDFSRLSDEDLDRLDVLVARLRLERGEPPGTYHRPGADDDRRGWSCGCEICALPAGAAPEPLEAFELRELGALLDRARPGAA